MNAKAKGENNGQEDETATADEAEAGTDTGEPAAEEVEVCGRCGKDFGPDDEIDCTHPRCPMLIVAD